jgi:hypothetical protein
LNWQELKKKKRRAVIAANPRISISLQKDFNWIANDWDSIGGIAGFHKPEVIIKNAQNYKRH